MADVIAHVTDGIATAGWVYFVADVNAKWQMEWPLGLFTSILVLRCYKQNLIAYVWQMVLAYVSIKGWIVDPYIQSFLDSSYEVLVLSPHNTEILNRDIVTSDVVMVKYWGRGFRCSLNLSPKVLEDSPIYSSSHSTLSHLYPYMNPLLFWIGS